MLPQTLFAQTSDGWQLAVHFWSHAGKMRRTPLLMIHGFGSNRVCFDFSPRYSFVHAACRRGFDVYVLELRGAGMSQARADQPFHWGFDDYNHKDLPAALDIICKHSGKTAVHALGHSMGGMLCYAMGCRSPQVFRSITTIGSPLLHRLHVGARDRRLLRVLLRLTSTKSSSRVPLRRLLGAAGRFVVPAAMSDGILMNVDNVDVDSIVRLANEAISDVPVKLIYELTHTVTNERTHLLETFAHELVLHEIRVPVLVLSGVCDRVAPPRSVHAAVTCLGSNDIRYREFGTQHGDKSDYGHVDLLIGKHAPDEVYPLVLDFVEEVD
jgi:pimeloyl-ACP methyl ester carboxylesterase